MILSAIISFFVIITCSCIINNDLYANSMIVSKQQQHPSQQKDWNIYNLQKKYHQSGGILYKQSVLTSTEYNAIINDLQSSLMNDNNDDNNKLTLKEEDESLSFATNRIGARISNESEIYRVLSCTEGSLCTLVNNLADYEVECNVGDGDDLGERRHDNDDNYVPESERSDASRKRLRSELGKMVLAPDIPIEVRVYEQKGAGMEWHIDDTLYNPEQIEVVYTVDNTSDCCTLWCPHDQQQQQRKPLRPTANNDCEQQNQKKHNMNNNNIQSVQTTPNSALIIKAGGVKHKVSQLTVGKRTILKMAFVREYAVLDRSMEGHASHHHHGKKKHKNKKTKKKKKNVQRIKSKRKKG